MLSLISTVLKVQYVRIVHFLNSYSKLTAAAVSVSRAAGGLD